MAQELINVETRVGRGAISGTPVVIYTPAVGERVHLLFILIHAMSTGSPGLSVTAGGNILIKIRNNATNPGVPTQSGASATGFYSLDSSQQSEFRMGQIKIPTIDDITNANPLEFVRDGVSGTFDITTSVWVVKE